MFQRIIMQSPIFVSRISMSERLPRNILSFDLFIKLGSVPNQLPATKCIIGPTMHLHPIKDIVVNILMMIIIGNNLLLLGIPDHNICISPLPNDALPGIHIKQLGSLSRGDPHKLILGQQPTPHTLRPHHCHPIFNTVDAIRDLSEIVLSHTLLLGAEGAVVGADDIDHVVVEHLHKVGFGGRVGVYWWGHYVTTGNVPVLVPEFFAVNTD
jgi:hypothetical protein